MNWISSSVSASRSGAFAMGCACPKYFSCARRTDSVKAISRNFSAIKCFGTRETRGRTLKEIHFALFGVFRGDSEDERLPVFRDVTAKIGNSRRAGERL